MLVINHSWEERTVYIRKGIADYILQPAYEIDHHVESNKTEPSAALISSIRTPLA
jgi:hypothetical protein